MQRFHAALKCQVSLFRFLFSEFNNGSHTIIMCIIFHASPHHMKDIYIYIFIYIYKTSEFACSGFLKGVNGTQNEVKSFNIFTEKNTQCHQNKNSDNAAPLCDLHRNFKRRDEETALSVMFNFCNQLLFGSCAIN